MRSTLIVREGMMFGLDSDLIDEMMLGETCRCLEYDLNTYLFSYIVKYLARVEYRLLRTEVL